VGASGLNVPLTPLPIVLDEVNGKIFNHMTRTENKEYVPDVHTRYGIGVQMFFFDQPTTGKIVAFDMSTEFTVYDDGFTIELFGDAMIANLSLSGVQAGNNIPGAETLKKNLVKSIASANGYMGYDSRENTFTANLTTTLNTQPLLCGGGETSLKISPKEWYVNIGTETAPYNLDILCRNKPQFQFWLEVNKQRLSMGLINEMDLRLETGWLGPKCCRIKPWAEFGYSFGAIVALQFDPKFAIDTATIWLSAYAGIGVKYDFTVKSGNLTILAVGVSGQVILVTKEEASYIAGLLKGYITVLNVGFNVDFEARVDF
jgi:hypothetical protein